MNRRTFLNECIHSFYIKYYMHILYLQKIVCRVLSILYIIEYILYKRYYAFMNYNGSFIIKGN